METDNNPISAAAHEFLPAGLSVIPVGQDKKAIGKWKSYQSNPMQDSDVDKYFKDAYGIAVVCGKGIEAVDIDSHGKDAKGVLDDCLVDERFCSIITRYKVYGESTKNGGFHLIYRHKSKRINGNKVLARWEDGSTMIETRGTGGYIITAPSPGYEKICDYDITEMQEMPEDDRNYFFEVAKHQNRHNKNSSRVDDRPAWVGMTLDEIFDKCLREIKEKQSFKTSNRNNFVYQLALRLHKEGTLTLADTLRLSARFEEGDFSLTEIENTVRSAYSDPYLKGIASIHDTYYIRVGVDYFKLIAKQNRYGIQQTSLKTWNDKTITLDHGRDFLKTIPKFDDFTIEPNNFDYQPIVNNCYNLYREFSHRPVKGSWRWSEILMRHIFGDQYELGLRYFQSLYLHPKHILPILCIVSQLRETGKTTFINWVNLIFGENVANITPQNLTRDFNGSYAYSNIITCEETAIDKPGTIEKLKALSTQKIISVNLKHINESSVPFYGKIILTSNSETAFVRIDWEEIRFFVRKIGKPTIENHNIEVDLKNEIPAFLWYLTTLPPVDFSRDRTGFTPEELDNHSLTGLKEESRSGLYKNLHTFIEDLFLNELKNDVYFYADSKSLKEKFFPYDRNIDSSYIQKVLKNEYGLVPQTKDGAPIYFNPFIHEGGKVGRPYLFNRTSFTNVPPEVEAPF